MQERVPNATGQAATDVGGALTGNHAGISRAGAMVVRPKRALTPRFAPTNRITSKGTSAGNTLGAGGDATNSLAEGRQNDDEIAVGPVKLLPRFPLGRPPRYPRQIRSLHTPLTPHP